MTSNHIFTRAVDAIKSINISDVESLSLSDTILPNQGHIVTANQYLYACPTSGATYNAPVAQVDVTDPTNLTFVQYINCSYLSYVSEYDDTFPQFPLRYGKWVLITGYVFKDPQIIPDPGNDHYVVLWAIDVSNPANPSVTSYQIEYRRDYTLVPWTTHCCTLGDVLIVAVAGYSEFTAACDLTSLPASITVLDTLNDIFEDVDGIAGNSPNFYVTDDVNGSVHSFSYSGGSISHLDTLELAID